MSEISLKEMLIEHHKEELEDAKKYSELCKEAYEEGYECVSGVLEDIANEEYSHAHALEHILKEVD